MNAAPSASSPLPLVAYLVAVTWAMMHSNRRWMTLLWIVASLAVVVGLFAAAAYIRQDMAEVLGHVAGIPALLVSAVVGLNHMRSHRRPTVPTPPAAPKV